MHNTQTVLFVDDFRPVRGALARAFRVAEYSVLEADNVDEALTVLASSDCALSVIISDIDMPGLPVQTLIDHARGMTPSIPVILISGSMDAREVGRLINGSELPFLAKPFEPEELIYQVRLLLGSPVPQSPQDGIKRGLRCADIGSRESTNE